MAFALNELINQNMEEMLYKRVRIYVKSVHRNESAALKLSSYMLSIIGIKHAKANHITGRILVIYDENLIDEIKIKKQILGYVVEEKSIHNSKTTATSNSKFKEELAMPISIEGLRPYNNRETQLDHRDNKPLYHVMNRNELEHLLKTDCNLGLTDRSAKEKLEELGLNVLSEKKRQSIIAKFFKNLGEFSTKLLIGVGFASLLLGQIPDAVAILGIVALQTAIGAIQEHKAEKSLHSLKDMLVQKAKVIRNGMELEINAKYLVEGDIILVEAGDKVPADARIIECTNLMATEATLTGESVPVVKDSKVCNKNDELSNRHNMLYMGTSILSGRGKALVVATGMNTEIGKIALMLQSIENKSTPLEDKINKFTNSFVKKSLILSIAISSIGLLFGRPLIEVLMLGISFSLASMPEGLPAVVTIGMALSVQRMAKKNAIVRKLPDVETLGSANVICCDKTGTLTMNEMTVRKIYVDRSFYEISGSGYNPSGDIKLKEGDSSSKSGLEELLKAGVLCNNACLINSKDKWSIQGDPTEAALIVAAHKQKLDTYEIENNYKRIKEIPFDSSRRYMTVAVESDDECLVYCKGALQNVMEKCKTIYENGEERLFTSTDREKIKSICTEMEETALRVLAFAYKKTNKCNKDIENNFVFIGIVGMEDPPREDVKASIQKCHRAGIKVVMITGDSKNTAAAVGKDLGLLTDGLVVTGNELDSMSDDELSEKICRIQIFARTSPEQKLRIVKAFKKAGSIVAMTGDGVNDAPAIKEADIGISMGKSGSDVAKDVASIVLTDDNFSTIVAAIEEGRAVSKNIKSSIRYLVGGNLAVIAMLFLSSLIGGIPPLLSIQILWVNVISETIMGLSLAVDPPSEDIMDSPPIAKDAPLVDNRLRNQIIKKGLTIGITTFALFKGATYLGLSLNKARTLAFSNLVLSQLMNAYDCRSNPKSLNNNYMNIASITSSGLLMSTIYLPFLNSFFGTMPLNPLDLAAIYGTTRLSKI